MRGGAGRWIGNWHLGPLDSLPNRVNGIFSIEGERGKRSSFCFIYNEFL